MFFNKEIIRNTTVDILGIECTYELCSIRRIFTNVDHSTFYERIGICSKGLHCQRVGSFVLYSNLDHARILIVIVVRQLLRRPGFNLIFARAAILAIFKF